MLQITKGIQSELQQLSLNNVTCAFKQHTQFFNKFNYINVLQERHAFTNNSFYR